MMKGIALLLLIIHFTRSEWSTPVCIHSDSELGISSGISLISDSTSSRSTILLSLFPKTKDAKANYGLRIHDKDSIKPFVVIDNEHDCTYGMLASEPDGKTVYSVASGVRSKSSSTVECDEGDVLGCSEILFHESKDGGDTWSAPVMVDRSNSSDMVQRRGANIIEMKNNARIYVFYSRTETFGKTTISYITRPPDSMIFSREADVASLSESLVDYGVSAAATVNNNSPLLHVGWVQGRNLMYTTSTNGISWANPVILSTINSLSQNMQAAQFISFRELPGTICSTYVTGDYKAVIRCGKGLLRTTTPVVIAESSAYVSAGACKGKNKIALAVRSVDESIRSFIFDMDNEKVTELPSPFGSKEFVYDFPQVSCENADNNSLYIKLVAYQRREHKEYLTINKLQFNTNTNEQI